MNRNKLYIIPIDKIFHDKPKQGYGDIKHLYRKLATMGHHINDPITVKRNEQGKYIIQNGNHRFEIHKRILKSQFILAYLDNPENEQSITITHE